MKKLFNQISNRLYYLMLPIRESGGYRIVANREYNELKELAQEAIKILSEEDHSPEWEN